MKQTPLRDDHSTISVWRLLKRHVLGKRIVLLSLTLLVTSFLTFIRPLIIKGITDEGMLKANMQVIIVCALLLLISAVIDQGISIIQSQQFVKMQNSMMLVLYHSAFDKLLRLKKDYFTKHNNVEIVNRVSTDIQSVGMLADRSILFVVSYTLSFIGGLIGLFVLNPKMSVAVILVIPLKVWTTINMSKRNEEISAERIQCNRTFSSWFGDIINGIKEVKLWNLRENVQEKLSDQQSEILQANRKSVLCSCYNQTWIRILDSMVQSTLYIYGGFLFLQGELSLGGVTAFISYSGYVLSPITSIMSIRYLISSITPSLKRLNEFFQLEENHQAVLPCIQSRQLTVTSFELRQVRFSHTQDPLLQNVNLKAYLGEKIAIIGPNGSGKSTLIDLLLRFERPESGKILINHMDIWDLPEDTYWSLFAVVEQEPYFFQDSIRYNLDPSGCHTDQEILYVLERCGAIELFQERFHGDLNHIIHFDAGDLSGGERKKLAVARAVLKNTPIIIMDEAAADYDTMAEAHLSQMISHNFSDKLILYITHNYSYLDIFDRVYEISNKTVQLLTKEEILQLKNIENIHSL